MNVSLSNSSEYESYVENSTAIFVDDSMAEEGQPRYVTGLLFAVLGVATILSVVVIIGLLVPLCIQLKNGSFYEARNGRTSRRSRTEPIYSTYNLYLVYSAFVDLIFPVSFMINSAYPLEAALHGNLWINAIIVYEVLVLLRASKSARRINQPTLLKVNLQAGAVIVGMILLTVIPMTVPTSYTVLITIWYCLYFIPILFVIGVTIFVKCKDYLPPSNGTTPRDKAVRGLALFFFRVILVFLVIWIPIMVLTMVNIFTNLESADQFRYDCTTNSASMFLIGFQPILNFCLILTKPDVKKYITGLVTLNYIFGDSNAGSSSKKSSFQSPGTTPSTIANRGDLRTRPSTTVFGYTYSGVDDDAHDSDATGSDTNAGEADENNNKKKSPTIPNASDGNNQDMETGISQ